MKKEISENMLKSGTSIVGIVCKDGVVMAGDRRATAGGIVMLKRAHKVVRINDYILVAGTGSVSDIDMYQKIIAAELRLRELKTRVRPTVEEAANLLATIAYHSIRNPSMIPPIVGTILAGYNEDGSSELYSIGPFGEVYQVKDYDANFSSGMPYILGLLERLYKKDLSVKEAVELAKECIKSAIERDTGSGNGIDVFSVTKDGIKQVIAEDIMPEYKQSA